jgi:hypothetical protein
MIFINYDPNKEVFRKYSPFYEKDPAGAFNRYSGAAPESRRQASTAAAGSLC